MAIETKISWCDSTWNPWVGCTKVSAGCKYCYMYRDMTFHKKDPRVVRRCSASTFNAPLRWAKNKKLPVGSLIFTCSFSDFFIEQADGWRAEVWKIIKNSPFIYLILTKRPERITDCLPDDWGGGYPNMWFGVSAENQEELERRLTLLNDVKAKVKFVSIEPMLGPIDIDKYVLMIDWIILGGESGNTYGEYRFRESRLEWFRNVMLDADQWDIPVFVKQLGAHIAKQMKLKDYRGGGDVNEFPVWLRRREFPRAYTAPTGREML